MYMQEICTRLFLFIPTCTVPVRYLIYLPPTRKLGGVSYIPQNTTMRKDKTNIYSRNSWTHIQASLLAVAQLRNESKCSCHINSGRFSQQIPPPPLPKYVIKPHLLLRTTATVQITTRKTKMDQKEKNSKKKKNKKDNVKTSKRTECERSEETPHAVPNRYMRM